MFTVPPGGDGVYYFSTYLLVDAGEYGNFDMYLNNDVICSTLLDHTSSGVDDYPPGSCSAVVNLVAGKECPFIVHMSWHLLATRPPLPPFFSKLQHAVTIVAA